MSRHIRLWIVRVGLLTGFTGIFACSPVNTTNSPAGKNKKVSNLPDVSDKSGDATSNVLPDDSTVGSTLLLPPWCKMNQTSDQVCFHCSRVDDNVPLEYEQCLTPAASFKSSSDCWFTDEISKKINCRGTRSGETFVMDVSIAKEKVTESLPAILLALNFAVASKYDAASDAVKFTRDISTFFGSRIQQIMQREDLMGVAGDLAMLVNKYTTSKLTREQSLAFRLAVYASFEIMLDELSGKKDFDLAGVLLKGTQLSKSLPPDLLGDSKDSFSGQRLAELLSDNNAVALERFFKIISPGASGVASQTSFLARLREAN